MNPRFQDGGAPVPVIRFVRAGSAGARAVSASHVYAHDHGSGSNMSTEELSASDSEAALAGAGERWAPVGAVASPELEGPHRGQEDLAVRLEELEEEQAQLNSSLLALTSHFAQVQFRLKQIVHAPSADKEKMLAELEEFAFRGCPHVVGCRGRDEGQLENSVRFAAPDATFMNSQH